MISRNMVRLTEILVKVVKPNKNKALNKFLIISQSELHKNMICTYPRGYKKKIVSFKVIRSSYHRSQSGLH